MPDTRLLKKFLLDAIQAFARQNTFALRELGNRAIENAALSGDKQLAEFALIAYCLHKLYSKQHIARHEKWQSLRRAILSSMDKAVNALESGNDTEFEGNMHQIISSIETIDEQIGYYTQGLYEKAKVKYASTAYALGVGLSQAAELTGADKKSLLGYIGATRVYDNEAVTAGIGERIDMLKRKMGGS